MLKQINILNFDHVTAKLWSSFIERTCQTRVVSYLARDFKCLSKKDLFHTDLWIIEVCDPCQPINPLGFHVAMSVYKNARVLLIFNIKPKHDFPDEGPFWITYVFSGSFIEKIKYLMSSHPPEFSAFQALLERYPQLGYRIPASHS